MHVDAGTIDAMIVDGGDCSLCRCWFAVLMLASCLVLLMTLHSSYAMTDHTAATVLSGPRVAHRQRLLEREQQQQQQQQQQQHHGSQRQATAGDRNEVNERILRRNSRGLTSTGSDIEANTVLPTQQRKRGRPVGSKDSTPRRPRGSNPDNGRQPSARQTAAVEGSGVYGEQQQQPHHGQAAQANHQQRTDQQQEQQPQQAGPQPHARRGRRDNPNSNNSEFHPGNGNPLQFHGWSMTIGVIGDNNVPRYWLDNMQRYMQVRLMCRLSLACVL